MRYRMMKFFFWGGGGTFLIYQRVYISKSYRVFDNLRMSNVLGPPFDILQFNFYPISILEKTFLT